MTLNKKYKWNIVWHNVILLLTLHLITIYGIYLRCTKTYRLESSLFVKIWALLSSWGITVGAHRLWAHRAYKANYPCQILLMLCASMTYQNSIYIWVRDHRLHHKYSETDADPHNAKRGFFFSHCGWLMVRKHPQVIEKGKEIDMSDLKANPIVMFQHKYYIWIMLTMLLIVPIGIPYYFWNEQLFDCFVINIYRYILTLNMTWTINSLAHSFGNKPFDKTIGPVENVFAQFLLLGEGFHNFHHTFPWDYRASEFGFDSRNTSTMIIDMFANIGWVTHRRFVSNDVIAMRMKRLGDGSFITPPRLFHMTFVILFIYLF